MGKHHVRYNEDIPARVIELFSLPRSSISKVCSKLRISRQTYYRWQEEHPEFRDACDIGENDAQSQQEDILERGANGEIEKFSAPAQIFLMKNRFRDTYGEQQQKSVSQSVVESVLGLLNGAE